MTDDPTTAFAKLLADIPVGALSAQASTARDIQIMERLLDFTQFEGNPGINDPFDDPYVGAALFTERYELLGAYRKRVAGERHSEPEAILAALEKIDCAESTELIKDIHNAYQRKIWLQETQRKSFEKLFTRSVKLIKDRSKSRKLILFSSLEPCGLYEASPSCANIIVASGIESVFYASDDTNPKGSVGRGVLLEGRVEVFPNFMFQKAVALNCRFFAAVEICQKSYNDYSIQRLFGGAPYAVFDETDDLFTAVEVAAVEDPNLKRLSVNPRVPFDIRFVGPEHSIVSPFITEIELNVFSQKEKKDKTTFFYGGTSIGELSKILYRETQIGGLPSTIIAPNDIKNMTKNTREVTFLQVLENNGVRIIPNAFRRHHEIWSANRHLILSEFRGEFQNHLTALLKIVYDESSIGDERDRPPYRFLFESADNLPLSLLNKCAEIETQSMGKSHVARITILGDALSQGKIINVLRGLQRSNRRGPGVLQRTSIEVGLVLNQYSAEPAADTKKFQELITGEINHLSVRVLPVQAFGISHSAKQLDRDIRSGRRDANFFDPTYIEKLSKEVDWVGRRSAGTILGQLAQSSEDYARDWILRSLRDLARREFQGGWTEACSKLNALRNASKTFRAYHEKGTYTALVEVATALNEIAAGDPPLWFEDLVWRWLACWFELGAHHHTEPLPEDLAEFISASPFLLSSAVQYTLRSSVRNSVEVFRAIVRPIVHSSRASFPASVTAARMLAAMETSESMTKHDVQLWLNAFQELGSEKALNEEYERSLGARQTEILGLANFIGDYDGKTFEKFDIGAEKFIRSLVAQRALGDGLGNSSEPDEFELNLDLLKTWREDHRVILEEVLSHTPIAWRAALLLAVAGDSDVSLRWAAVYLALNQKWVPQLFGETSPARDAVASKFRKTIIDVANEAGGHYWIEREIIHAFLKVHGPRCEGMPRPIARSFPTARDMDLKHYLQKSTCVHPELEASVKDLRSRCKKVLLLLPPITWAPLKTGDGVAEQVNEGTPPLGLGQIAATLSAAGHYVEIIDAHRYGYTAEEVAKLAADFDYIGISVVFSTIQSTAKLTTLLKRSAEIPKDLKIVIGGHAFTLDPKKVINSNLAYDFLVFGPGELAFSKIIDSVATGKEIEDECIVVGNDFSGVPRLNGGLRGRLSTRYQEDWNELPLVERSNFRDPSDKPFEPAKTRNGAGREAHFVMSKGCDWNCSFCTEAILAGTREVRRSVQSILEEVKLVCEDTSVRHAQFIDDNVFPQIAAPGLNEDQVNVRSIWTDSFLHGLKELRDSTRGEREQFSWRGLVRLEDILMYVQRKPQFLEDLAKSGCGLLAFGVEHGNEDVRRNLKGPPPSGPTNEEICKLVRDLKGVGIYTKAYFMMGGPHDSEAGANETINFALSSGVDLAYFAIFKNFRAGREERKSPPAQTLNFSQFAFNLEKMILAQDASEWSQQFGSDLRYRPDQYQAALHSLKNMEFSFSNLFKYSDYHEDQIFDVLYFNDRDLYFKLLRKAYLEFYARGDWVNIYAELIDKGY